MTSAAEKRIQTTIQSKGKARSGDGWMLVLAYKMPGSNYETTLYGKDWELVENFNPGDPVTAVLARGRVKEGKDGSRDYNYFWDLVDLTALEDTKEPPTTQAQGTKDTAAQVESPQDPIQERIERGMAFNAAYTILAQRPVNDEAQNQDFIEDLRRLRDILYHDVIRVPVAPLHYCYEHETARIQNPKSSNWAHRLPDKTWCIDPTAAPAGAGAADMDTQEPM